MSLTSRMARAKRRPQVATVGVSWHSAISRGADDTYTHAKKKKLPVGMRWRCAIWRCPRDLRNIQDFQPHQVYAFEFFSLLPMIERGERAATHTFSLTKKMARLRRADKKKDAPGRFTTRPLPVYLTTKLPFDKIRPT